MSLSFTHLGTGSRGNATLLECGEIKLLIDQGFSGKELTKRLARMDIRVDEIDALLITHHHTDHASGVAVTQRRWNIPVYCNDRTATALNLDLRNVHLFENLEALNFADAVSYTHLTLPTT